MQTGKEDQRITWKGKPTHPNRVRETLRKEGMKPEAIEAEIAKLREAPSRVTKEKAPPVTKAEAPADREG